MYQFTHWKAALENAATADEVLAVIADYASRLAPGDKAGLPAACKSALRELDIPRGAATLVREELQFRGDAGTADLLHEIARTFMAAANRLGRLDSARSPTGEP